MHTRRQLLWTSMGFVLVGCGAADKPDSATPGADTGGSTPTGTPIIPGPAACLDPPLGSFIRDLPFEDETPRDLETLTGEGLEGRYVLDLTTVDDAVLVVPTARFFIRTAQPDLIDTADWVVRIGGRVSAPADVPIADLLALARPQGVVHFECSGNTAYGGFGLQSAADFDGVPVGEVFALAAAETTRVRISGFDEHSAPSTGSDAGASWVFTVAELEAAGAFFATGMNGEALPDDHGFPVRLVIPAWYGCAMIKWVNAIDFVDENEPATGQMMEFASRTHQPGVPALARDYLPAEIDVAALPIRVEEWEVDGERVLWIVGLVWGGTVAAPPLRLHLDDDEEGEPVEVCPERTDARTWGLWSHTLPTPRRGSRSIWLTVDDPAVRTRRLDDRYYERFVDV
ncbi:MAG: DMSO/TMAO reductase YedYZ molybdopterin-dependent catalytic subunit [Myxococcota bacterium]|jgi:DMSO/TMAO reductase YedYZ molybdopterin-dependent catalytic subunit